MTVTLPLPGAVRNVHHQHFLVACRSGLLVGLLALLVIVWHFAHRRQGTELRRTPLGPASRYHLWERA